MPHYLTMQHDYIVLSMCQIHFLYLNQICLIGTIYYYKDLRLITEYYKNSVSFFIVKSLKFQFLSLLFQYYKYQLKILQ